MTADSLCVCCGGPAGLGEVGPALLQMWSRTTEQTQSWGGSGTLDNTGCQGPIIILQLTIITLSWVYSLLVTIHTNKQRQSMDMES